LLEEHPYEITPEMKRKTLLACLFALCVGNMMIQCVVGFLPLFIDDKFWDSGRELTETDIAFILGIFAVA
jgi:hypothetical protein